MLNFQIEVNGETYDAIGDWDIYPKRFNLGKAVPKIAEFEVPYRDGTLKASGWTGGPVVFKNRKVNIPFLINHPDPEIRHQEISDILNGEDVKLITSSNPDYYFEGICSVGEPKTSGSQWISEININAYPYKKKRDLTVFSHDFDGSGEWNVTLKNEKMPAEVNFQCADKCMVSIGDRMYSFSGATKAVLGFIPKGEIEAEVTSQVANSVTISYREGGL